MADTDKTPEAPANGFVVHDITVRRVA